MFRKWIVWGFYKRMPGVRYEWRFDYKEYD